MYLLKTAACCWIVHKNFDLQETSCCDPEAVSLWRAGHRTSADGTIAFFWPLKSLALVLIQTIEGAGGWVSLIVFAGVKKLQITLRVSRVDMLYQQLFGAT